MQYWLFKSEPEAWSWEAQKAKGLKGEPWDGIRNYQANNNMKLMRIGDLGFFYHSVKERRIVGIVKVIKEHYPDHTDSSARFGMVDVVAVCDVPSPVTLADIKAHPELQDIALVKQSRLSVVPVNDIQWNILCAMGDVTSDMLSGKP
ncbi:MAG: EVE domain-containing protein [Pseudomonadota bacterium]